MTFDRRLSLYHFYNVRITAALAAVCALAALLYGIFLLLAVEQAADRARNERAIKALTSELAGLQQDYLLAAAALTPERAAAMGLVVPPKSAVSFARADAPTLTLRTQ